MSDNEEKKTKLVKADNDEIEDLEEVTLSEDNEIFNEDED